MITKVLSATLLTAGLAASVAAMGHGHKGGGGGPVDCEAARCALEAQIDAACPCTGPANHGGYVKCVTHELKQLAQNGSLPKRCRGKVVRCAARSVCGKTDAVTCTMGTSCRVVRSSQACTTDGGTPGTAANCCTTCASPSGAFLN